MVSSHQFVYRIETLHIRYLHMHACMDGGMDGWIVYYGNGNIWKHELDDHRQYC